VRADENRVITKMKEDGFVFLFLYEEQKMFMEEESRKSGIFLRRQQRVISGDDGFDVIFEADLTSFSEPAFGVIFPAKSIISGNID